MVNRSRGAKYHDAACQLRQADRMKKARRKERKEQARHETLTRDPRKVSSAYRGEWFQVLWQSGIGPQAVEEGRKTGWILEQLDALTHRRPHQTTLSAAMRAIRIKLTEEAEQAEWSMSWDTRRQLMLHRPDPEVSDPLALEAWLDEAVESFIEFEAQFWKLPNGKPYIRKDFHRLWIKLTLKAYLTGSQVLILSPPRHGKTELLQHFCVWLICRNPNIRILWVGVNGDIAAETTGAVLEMLDDPQLVLAVLGPGGTFRPPARYGSSWKPTRFTVGNRTVRGMKAPTLAAQGRGGKLLSKDADLIIGDDLEDYDSTETPGAREGTRRWWGTQMDSRKTVNCGWMMIGSRQHPDDLYNYLIDDPTWEVVVHQAHDVTCQKDQDDVAAHTDCMLFPEINPYRWLLDKLRSFRSRGQETLFEMVYLNDPTPEGLVTWTRAEVKTSHNPEAGLGLDWLGKEGRNYHLIGGLDPAATRYQSAFCWAVELLPQVGLPGQEGYREATYVEHMIDLDNRLGGGVDAFIDGPGGDWLTAYGLRHWVIEDNLFRQVFSRHPRLLKWQGDNGILIEPISTQGSNKWDPLYGVKAMHKLWTANPLRVSLPYGTPEARVKTEVYTTQLIRFTEDLQKLRRQRTDVLMASWFPQRTIIRWFDELLMGEQVNAIFGDASYPDFDQSSYNEAPF